MNPWNLPRIATGVLLGLTACTATGSIKNSGVEEGDTVIHGDSAASGDSHVPGDSAVQGDSHVPGDSTVQGDSHVPGECFTAEDCNDDNECTTDACTIDVCDNAPVEDGTACTTGVCQVGNCVACDDGVKNNDETGIDCGGSCPDQDCCVNGYLDTNLDETGVDCGGSCEPCSVPNPCMDVDVLPPLESGHEVQTVTVEFETSSYTLPPGNEKSAVATAHGATYFVWVDANGHPWVGKIQDGVTTTSRLDPLDDYQASSDGHHSFSLGVDRDGYIHVEGDMHEYPLAGASHLPDRYTDQIILYWKSTAPHSVSSFEFVGGDPDRAIPGKGWSYLAFRTDMNGKLYVRSRSYADSGGHHPGQYGWRLHVYDETSETWSALGGIPPSDRGTYASIFWEDDASNYEASPSQSWYQGFMSDIKFDFNNRMHVSTCINNNYLVTGSTDVLYAYSDDGGMSFHRADGSAIASLPLRAEAGTGQADVVETGRKYWSYCPVSFDRCGVPLVGYTVQDAAALYGYEAFYYRYWDASADAWSATYKSPAGGLIRANCALGADGVLNYISPDTNGKIYRTRNLGETGYAFYLDGRFTSVDLRALREQNILRGVRVVDGKLQIVRVEFQPVP